ncbi:MAG: helix-turn-helix domain-containing protein [Gallionellaceae bacterium]|nr:helix-turn-helix domain-containing protein [Gallionellaceae bacterium]
MSTSLSVEQLHSILASFPDPVFLLTRSGRYAAIYGGTDSRYYHDGSGLVGKHLHDVLKPDKADWFLAEIAKVLELRGMHILEYGLDGSDVLGLDDLGPSDTIWFEGRVQALDFLIDEEEAVLWVASNITDRINIEMELSDAMRQEREAIDVLWRRIASARSNKKVIARWTLDVAQSRLIPAQGEPIALTGNEAHLLNCLAESEGALVSKERLCARMFPGTDPKSPERLTVTLSRLRKKLARHQCDLVVRSVFGKGFALTEDVRIL